MPRRFCKDPECERCIRIPDMDDMYNLMMQDIEDREYYEAEERLERKLQEAEDRAKVPAHHTDPCTNRKDLLEVIKDRKIQNHIHDRAKTRQNKENRKKNSKVPRKSPRQRCVPPE